MFYQPRPLRKMESIMIDKQSSKLELDGPDVDSAHVLNRISRHKICMNLKSQLKFYLDHKGITAVQLSKATGVSKQVISLWLGGGSPRKLDQIKKVSDYFGISIDHICFGKGLVKINDKNNLESIPENEWVGGVFEVKFRRVK